jgi:hypothetical protein
MQTGKFNSQLSSANLHVKPPKRPTSYNTTTSAWRISSIPIAILDIEIKWSFENPSHSWGFPFGGSIRKTRKPFVWPNLAATPLFRQI